MPITHHGICDVMAILCFLFLDTAAELSSKVKTRQGPCLPPHKVGHGVVSIKGNNFCNKEQPKPSASKILHFSPNKVNNPLLAIVLFNMESLAKFLFQFLKGTSKIFYERRDYKSVDEKSLS